MLLAIDAGNTTVMYGVFAGEELRGTWRMLSQTPRTSDEWGMALNVQAARLGWQPEDITGVVISSVSPTLNGALSDMCHKYLGQTPLFVDASLDLGMAVRYTDPRQVGADRLCSAVAGRAKYGQPLIILDFGTATTFDILDAQGDYIGGIIAPGLETATAVLHHGTAKLPQVELRFPPQVIGRDTESSIQSGILYGAVAMLEGLITRVREELGAHATVVATGGLAEHLKPKMSMIDHYDENLVLSGLRIIYHTHTSGR